MIDANVVTVGTEPYLVNMNELVDSVPGQTVAIRNRDESESIYWGGPNVTSETGYPIDAGKEQSFDLKPGQELYLIAETEIEVSLGWIDLK